MAFSDSSKWRVEHPHTLYSWEGACVWIPCTYTVYSGSKEELEELIVYRNYKYDEATKSFEGLILYNDTKPWKRPDPLERVQFLGDQRSNCTIHINPVLEEDDGWLGLRMIKKNSKWMTRINLNVSSKALGDGGLGLGFGQGGRWETPNTWERGCKPGCLWRPGKSYQ